MSDFLKTKDEVKDRIKALGGRAKDFRENTHKYNTKRFMKCYSKQSFRKNPYCS